MRQANRVSKKRKPREMTQTNSINASSSGRTWARQTMGARRAGAARHCAFGQPERCAPRARSPAAGPKGDAQRARGSSFRAPLRASPARESARPNENCARAKLMARKAAGAPNSIGLLLVSSHRGGLFVASFVWPAARCVAHVNLVLPARARPGQVGGKVARQSSFLFRLCSSSSSSPSSSPSSSAATGRRWQKFASLDEKGADARSMVCQLAAPTRCQLASGRPQLAPLAWLSAHWLPVCLSVCLSACLAGWLVG